MLALVLGGFVFVPWRNGNSHDLMNRLITSLWTMGFALYTNNVLIGCAVGLTFYWFWSHREHFLSRQ
jgi:branched-subunit amino acid transport protein